MKDEETGLEIYGIPNAETLDVMKEANEITSNHSASFSSAEELFASIEGPIVVKDEETGLLYVDTASVEAATDGKYPLMTHYAQHETVGKTTWSRLTMRRPV